jgi:hydrogenase maturation protease
VAVPPNQLLVIGYGNTLRRDDGAGPAVAEHFAALGIAGIEVLTCPLLTPELAEAVAQSPRVVFVDASIEGSPTVQLRELVPATSSQIMAHAADPRTILALARDVYASTPRAWCVTIPAFDLGFGTECSDRAREGIAEAIRLIHQLAAKD